MKLLLQFLGSIFLFLFIWHLIRPEYTQVSDRFFRNNEGEVFIRREVNEVSNSFFDKTKKTIVYDYLKIYKIDIETYRQIGLDDSDFSMAIDTDYVYKDYNCYAESVITPIKNIDAPTFKHLSGAFFKDKNSLFYKHEMLEGFNLDSLVILDKTSKGIPWKDGYSVIRDHKTVCYYGDIIHNMDMSTLQVYKSPYSKYYGIKDKNWIYEKVHELRGEAGYIKLSTAVANIHVDSEI